MSKSYMKFCVAFLGTLIIFGVVLCCRPARPPYDLDYGESCITGYFDHCNWRLKCDESTRRCDCFPKEDMIYDGVRKICLVKASKLCEVRRTWPTPETVCVQNAACGELNCTYYDNGFCGVEDPPHCTGTCQCDDETTIPSDLRCLKQHNYSCSISDPCDEESGLICGPAGKCICANPSEQYYVYHLELYGMLLSKSICCIKINGECDPPYNICGPNAECTSTGRCVCKTGYVPDFNFEKCFRGYNQTCTNSSDYNDGAPNGGEECNKDTGLECVNGRCVCLSSFNQQYDEQKKMCASTERQPCTCLTQNSGHHYGNCMSGLTCTKIVTNNVASGICRHVESDEIPSEMRSRSSGSVFKFYRTEWAFVPFLLNIFVPLFRVC